MELRMAIDGSVQTSTCEREQEVGYLNVFQQQLQSIEEANPSSAQTLGIVSMKLNDLRECERDDYGIVVGVGDAKLQRNPPTISATPGVVTEVLQQRVDLATEGLARNAGLSSGARQVSDLTRDGHTPMVFGPLLHATGSIEGSSGAMEELARKHASRSKRTREDAIVRDGAHKRRKEDRRKSFPHRLLKASDAMASKGEQVGVCGEYVSRLKEQAELDEAPKEEKKRLLLISKNKGQSLVLLLLILPVLRLMLQQPSLLLLPQLRLVLHQSLLVPLMLWKLRVNVYFGEGDSVGADRSTGSSFF
jgi:hypothetical protein